MPKTQFGDPFSDPCAPHLLPMGSPMCDLHNILMTFGIDANQYVTNANLSKIVFTLLRKSFPQTHEHTNPQVGSAGARSVMNYKHILLLVY